MSDTIFNGIPEGWRFYTCDASIDGRFYITLTRDAAGRRLWFELPEDVRNRVDLFATASRNSFGEALADAIQEAKAAQALPLIEAGA